MYSVKAMLKAAPIIKLEDNIIKYNEAYRAGKPLISDQEYDELIKELRALSPDHPRLNQVEEESAEVFGKERVKHPSPMLSTEKAYTEAEVFKFIDRIVQAAAETGIKDVRLRVTPKLDGLAGRDDGTKLVTRGNGTQGYDITRAFERGLVAVGGRGRHVGEIVINKQYFDEKLSEDFEHPRNFMVGLTSADDLNESAITALEAGVARFVPYSTLNYWEGTAESLRAHLKEVEKEISICEYPIDGIVIECTNLEIKECLGATSHHHKWQLALKPESETAETTVESIAWQVGRTGKVTPVLMVSPVEVSGATIRKVTAHNAGHIRDKNIGVGTKIKIKRAGEVIPKLLKVLEFTTVIVPSSCPCCDTGLMWQNDFLICINKECDDQQVGKITHFFKTLGQADGFGVASANKIVEYGITDIPLIYASNEQDFEAMGFGAGESANLVSELRRSRTQPLDDWRFLAAFGISDLGRGDSRKLLKEFPLETLGGLTQEELIKVKGFGGITSESIVSGLQENWLDIESLLNFDFNLTKTGGVSEVVDSPIAGKRVVFTGAFESGSRNDLQAQARSLGAETPSSMSKSTDILVCGEKVGASKTVKAEKFGTTVMSEQQYLELIK